MNRPGAIALETDAKTGMVPLFPDEKNSISVQKPEMEGIPGNSGRSGQNQGPDAKATAESIRAASRNVHP